MEIADRAMRERTRNSAALASFAAYCHNNPDQRFWQALRNWSRYRSILGVIEWGDGMFDPASPAPEKWENTYRLEGLQGSRIEARESGAGDDRDDAAGDGRDQRGLPDRDVADRDAGDGGLDDGVGDPLHRLLLLLGDLDPPADPAPVRRRRLHLVNDWRHMTRGD